MRNDALVNGLFVGLGLGFILATLALYFPVRDFFPQYAAVWQFKFVGIVGGVALIAGVALEVYQRRRKSEGDDEEEDNEDDEVEDEE